MCTAAARWDPTKGRWPWQGRVGADFNLSATNRSLGEALIPTVGRSWALLQAVNDEEAFRFPACVAAVGFSWARVKAISDKEAAVFRGRHCGRQAPGGADQTEGRRGH